MAIIEYSTEGHRAVITINRPDARNAVNGEVAGGIEEAIDRLEADDSLWVGILTGVPPVFSAGADLKEINAGRAVDLTTARGGFGGITRRETDQAHHRRRRRPGPGGRYRDRPGLRPDRGVDDRPVRGSRGQAQPGGRGRRALPPATEAAVQRGDGADPHRRPDRRPTGPPLRPGQRPLRARPGPGGGQGAGRARRGQRPGRGASVPSRRPGGHDRGRARRPGACRARPWPRPWAARTSRRA